MRFIFKLLPIILITLFFSLIYFGGKRAVTYVDENGGLSENSFVTQNLADGMDTETSLLDDSYNDVENLATGDIIDDAGFEEDLDEEMDSAEESLDVELEGKSSNQLITRNKTKKALKQEDKAKKATSKKKTNKKPSRERWVSKGSVPSSYDSNSSIAAKFLVIAGSFKSKANANDFIDVLEHKGLHDIEIIELKNKNLNRVCISRHSTYEGAKKVTDQLRKQHNVEAYVHRKVN